MTRAPGNPKEKRQLLTCLDAESFAHLVADILCLVLGHHDVSVVDGPGDGRRDIHSVTPNGVRFLTQCKYHADTSATVSARETDELSIALLKFGVRSGLFATSAKLSPQAKREYLDNFPDLELEFLDGSAVADHVLTTPSLRSAWFDGESIARTTAPIGLPFALRDVATDMPRKVQIEHVDLDGSPAPIMSVPFDSSLLGPYRVGNPLAVGDRLGIPIILLTGAYLHQFEALAPTIVRALCDAVAEPGRTTALRVGQPRFLCLRGKDRFDPGLPLDLGPWAYFLTETKVLSQRAMLLPMSNDWRFPRRVSTLTARDCHWYNAKYDCVLKVGIAVPASAEDKAVARYVNDMLQRSVVLRGTTKQIGSLALAVPNSDAPSDLFTAAGESFAVWYHPRCHGPFATPAYASADGDEDPDPFVEWQRMVDEDFAERRDRVQALARAHGCSFVPWSDAEPFLRIAGLQVSQHSDETFITSAELVYALEAYEAPVDLRSRELCFTRFYHVPSADLDSVRDSLGRHDFSEVGVGSLAIVAAFGAESKEIYVDVSLTLRPEISRATTSYVEEGWPSVEAALFKVEKKLLRALPGAVLATARFWRSETEVLLPDGGDAGE